MSAEDQGWVSRAGAIAQRRGVPVSVGVANATSDLRLGEFVTLEVREGVVHRGARNHTQADRSETIL